MARGMAAPAEFKVTAMGDRFTVGWSDAEARYHVWLFNGEFGKKIGGKKPIIYKNPAGGGKTSYMALKSHPRIEAAILAIPPSEFEAAKQRAEAAEAERTAKARLEAVEQLREDARRMGFEIVPIKAEAAE